MIKKRLATLLIYMSMATIMYAQPSAQSTSVDTLVNQADPKSQLSFTGFIDTYYAYDFNRPADNERPDFLYNHKRHNEFTLNLAIIKAAYTGNKVRATVGLMAGTYAQYNLAHEQELLRHIWEANAGIRLAKNVWLDAGIFLSHIGFENAISTENFTLTRSLMAENTPYYLSGAKVTYTPDNSAWELAVVVANGWQNICETESNSNKAIGTQLTFTPTSRFKVNYSTFISNEYPDNSPRWRYLNNFYSIIQASNNLQFIAAFDAGFETMQLNAGSTTNAWLNPAVLFHYQAIEPLAFGGRWEYYRDPTGIIIDPQQFKNAPLPINNPNGFRCTGYSLNVDLIPAKGVMLRTEGRILQSKDSIFVRDLSFSHYTAAITTSLAVNF